MHRRILGTCIPGTPVEVHESMRRPTTLVIPLAVLWSSSASAQSPSAPAQVPSAAPSPPRYTWPGIEELPERAPYYPDEPVPEGYQVVSRPNWAISCGCPPGT